MKKAITVDLYSRWKEERYKKMKEHGYLGANYSMANTETLIYTCSEDDMKSMMLHEKELAHSAGVEIFQVHGPWRWPPRDSTIGEQQERMEKMKKSIRATALLGCHYWVIHPLSPWGIDEKGTEAAKKTWDFNLCFMRELLETAKRFDITICLENLPFLNFSLATPSDILRFVKEIDDEYFKICLDTGHVAVFENLEVNEAIRELGQEIRVLHVHDNNRKGDQHMIPYFGRIDWSDFNPALKDIGFNGMLTMETVLPEKLSTPLYEEICRLTAKIAEKLIE